MALDITEIKIRDKVTIAGTEITSVETTLTGGNSALPRADAVKAYVDGLLNANDAMQFKGTIGTGGTVTALPTTHSAGWTYRVITAATYAGVVTEVGDLIIAVVDRAGSGNANSDWTVVQTNIDGAVVGPASAVSANVARFNGTSGKIIQDSGVAFETSLTTNSDAKAPTSKAVATYVTGLGYVTSSGVTSVTGTAPIVSSGGAAPAISITAATTSAAGSMSSADKTKLDGIAAGAQVNVATNLSYTDSTRVIGSSTGTGATLPLVVAAGIAGLMTGADKTKLDGIASGATANTGTVTGVTGTAPIASSGGTAPVISITAATTSAAGSMSSADKTKLDGIAAGAQVNVATNLAQGTRTTTTVPITSSTGTSATLDIATTSLAGVMSSADKTKLDGIATGATANTGTVTGVTGTAPIASSGGTAPIISISAATQSAAGSMSSADKTKLDGIATGATANAGTVTSVSAGTQISGMAMTITNGTTTPSIATSVSNAANFRTAIGAGTGNGTVTSVGGTGTVSGLTLSGTVTTSGSLTLGGTLAVLPSNFASQTANTFLAAPNGTNGVPTFRAIVAADIPTLNQSTTGSASTVNGTNGQLLFKDDRIIEPNSILAERLQFGFTSYGNNNTSPYADYLHLRSYSDGSGGSDNLVMFRKDAIGMRIYQQTFGSASAYSTYKDVAFTDSNITGNAATATSASNIDGIAFRNGNSTNGINPDSVNENGTGYINSVTLFGQTDGALYSQAYNTSWVHQIFGDYRTGSMAVRGRNNGTLTAWRTVWDSGNDGSGSGLDADLLDGNHASAFAAASHAHTFNDISGTLPISKGGTGTTTVQAGGVVFGSTGGGSYTSTVPTGTGLYLGSNYNGVNYFPSWTSPSDATSLTTLSTGSTLITERDVYWGTRYKHLGVTTTAGQNVSRTITFTSGMRNFILQLHQDSTTGAVIARLPLQISNSAGQSGVTDVYSLDTSTRTHRVSWSNGSATQIMNVSVSYSGTTLTVSQSFNFNCAFRLFGI